MPSSKDTTLTVPRCAPNRFSLAQRQVKAVLSFTLVNYCTYLALLVRADLAQNESDKRNMFTYLRVTMTIKPINLCTSRNPYCSRDVDLLLSGWIYANISRTVSNRNFLLFPTRFIYTHKMIYLGLLLFHRTKSYVKRCF